MSLTSLTRKFTCGRMISHLSNRPQQSSELGGVLQLWEPLWIRLGKKTCIADVLLDAERVFAGVTVAVLDIIAAYAFDLELGISTSLLHELRYKS